MTHAIAAGRKTDVSNERGERIAAALEEQFLMCRQETDLWMARNRAPDGALYQGLLDELMKAMRIGIRAPTALWRSAILGGNPSATTQKASNSTCRTGTVDFPIRHEQAPAR